MKIQGPTGDAVEMSGIMEAGFQPLGVVPARRGGWIQTFTGKRYYPADPRAEDVCLEDIAHALSMICRYTGHTREFYSVAEHSVLVSQLVPFDLRFEALLHDAAEAYCHDLSSPLKASVPDYRQILDLNERLIREVFGLPEQEHPEVKKADLAILPNEYAVFMPEKNRPDLGPLIPHLILRGLSPKAAEHFFMDRFTDLLVDWRPHVRTA